MKYIVKNGGNRDISHLREQIPNLIVVQNNEGAMEAFIEALEAAGDDSAVHLEDDIILCENFTETLEKAVEGHEGDVIQFFSMRKDDLTIGTRYIPGYKYLMNQCVYLPKGMSKELVEYRKTWKRIEEHPTGTDVMVADFLGERKIKYLNWVPNLVDHMVGKSLINPKRSSKRQSLTFGNKHLGGADNG